MSLIKCPECGADVSDSAAACKSCGFDVGAWRNKMDVILEEARLLAAIEESKAAEKAKARPPSR